MEYRINSLIIITTLFIKSLLTSLFQREGKYPSLAKRGKGRFCGTCQFNFGTLNKIISAGFLIFLGLISFAFAENYSLQYFLTKVTSKPEALSKKEKVELLNQIDRLLEKALQVHGKVTRDIQTGEIDIRYQEGDFWISKLKEDRKSIEAGMEQVKLLKEKPGHLVGSIRLYKSLKDLSVNFNAYNNMPSFSAFVGDLAPELELWADPVFFQLYLLPLARLKDIEKEPPKKEKMPAPKGKKP
jgi:hypothetical protein